MKFQYLTLVCFVYSACEASPTFPNAYYQKQEALEEWRINGGEDASLHEFPYQAALTNILGRLFCGASLINERYVLTAGHCVNRVIAENVFVLLGDHDRSTEDETKHVVIQADKLIAHPKFNMQTTFNDIGLVRLATPFKNSDFIKPICLSTAEFSGPKAVVSGWGAASIEGHAVDRLQKLELQVLRYDDCSDMLKGFRIFLTKEKICGWQPHKDSCRGDSGGPLATVEQGENRRLVGVVSMGFQCGRPNLPGLYTRISSYVDWIKENTQDATETCYV